MRSVRGRRRPDPAADVAAEIDAALERPEAVGAIDDEIRELRRRRRRLEEERSELGSARDAALTAGNVAAVKRVDGQLADLDREEEVIERRLPALRRPKMERRDREREATRSLVEAAMWDAFLEEADRVYEAMRRVGERVAAIQDAAEGRSVYPVEVPGAALRWLGFARAWEQEGRREAEQRAEEARRRRDSARARLGR